MGFYPERPLSHRAPNGSRGVGALRATGFAYLEPVNRCEMQFAMRHANHAGSERLRLLLADLYLKQLGV